MNPLDMPTGRQNRAAKKAGLTLAEWRAQQKGAQEVPEAVTEAPLAPVAFDPSSDQGGD